MNSPIADELVLTLQRLNGRRLRGEPDEVQEPAPFSEELTAASRRLAVYGTLAPGQPNHGRLDRFSGTWTRGVVRGDLHPGGWGSTMGYPAMTWREGGPEVAVHLLESEALSGAWSELDTFEGTQYLRVLVPVMTGRGVIVANLYAWRTEMERLASE